MKGPVNSGETRSYLCIDLKSFYASVECVQRGWDPMTTNLVVADPERSEKTICLAVSPSLKALGVKNRCRVFQIPEGLEYFMAPPRMQLYIDYSARIYGIYLRYVSSEDIHVYSIDEAFLDVTDYLQLYGMDARQLGARIMNQIREETGIPAACGVGTNLYLAKIALDILAKRTRDHMAVLDEEAYRRILWDHRPLTDFWRIGAGTAARLERAGIFTMRELARADPGILERIFGVDGELLLDHAWGRESATLEDIKNYRPKSTSLSSGQVLARDYGYEEGKLIVKEMADLLSLDLVEQRLVTDTVTLHVGYSRLYGAKPAHGTMVMTAVTSSSRRIMADTGRLYERIVDRRIPIRRVNLTFSRLMDESCGQWDLFTDPRELEQEHSLQQAVLDIRHRFGKNAILRCMDLQENATTRERNGQIGGHKMG